MSNFKEPVFCKVTKLIYEKSIINKAIEENGKCPITGINIYKEDLIEIKKPEFIISNDNPMENFNDILNKLQNEYNSMIFEKFSLEKELNAIEKELNEKIYKNEAAKLVISRLLNEINELKK